MEKIDDIIKQMKGLSRDAVQYLLFKALTENVFNFTQLSEAYVEYLEKEREGKGRLIANMAIPLVQYWSEAKEKTRQDQFIKAKGAYYLLKSKVYETAKVEEDFKKTIKKYKAGEDEHGMFRFSDLFPFRKGEKKY